MNSEIRKIFISAGEQSGDLHGGELIKSLITTNPNKKIIFTGLGGNEMSNAGAKLLYHISELAVSGLTGVIMKYRFFHQVLRKSIEQVKYDNPSCVILIDYPGFNLAFTEKLRSFYRGKIIYYISPQLWAWHEKRVFKIKKNVDKMLVVFPFEVDFYKKYDIEAEYVGHPLINRINNFKTSAQHRKKIYGEEKVISILPGSRWNEIKIHLPVLLNTAEQLMKEFDLKINVSIAPSIDDSALSNYIKYYNKINFTRIPVYELIYNADLVLTKAGTSTIECALLRTPFISFYKTNLINYFLLKPLVKVKSLCMVNILTKKNIVKEFIQKDYTEDKLLNECRRILTDSAYLERIRENLKTVEQILGNRNASENAAKIISNYLH